MDCEALMEKACLFQAYEVMQENMDNFLKTSKETDELYKIIKKEYSVLRESQCRMKTAASWKSSYVNKHTLDSDDKFELHTSTLSQFKNDVLVHMQIVDTLFEPLDILKHLDLCNLWIETVIESKLVCNVTTHISVIKLVLQNKIHKNLTPRLMFIKVMHFDNTDFDGSMGSCITYLKYNELKEIIPAELHKKYAKNFATLKSYSRENSIGNFDSVTCYFHDMVDRKKKMKEMKMDQDSPGILKCTILIHNICTHALLPSFATRHLVLNFVYTACIWWTGCAKTLSYSTRDIAQIQTRIYKERQKSQDDDLLEQTLLVEQEKLDLLVSQALLNVSVNLIDI